MPMRPEGASLDGPCVRCGSMYVPWVAEDRVWNLVVGGHEDVTASGRWCVTCFCIQADSVFGGSTVWKVAPR